MLRSRVNLRELERTRNPGQRSLLLADYEVLEPIPLDERHYGQSQLLTDPYGGSVSNPLVSDVQDERMLAELECYLKRRDAEHITQAVCNSCDVFLTRDEDSIIKFRGRIETRFRPLRVLLPSELETELKSVAVA